LLVVDARAGKLVQRVKLFTEEAAKAPKIHAKNSHASPTPLVAGDRIYVHFGHQGTACTSLGGEVLWRNDQVSYTPVHGNGGSPVLVDKTLIFSQDGASQAKVVALNADTGDLRWQVERNVEVSKTFSFATPLVLETSGKRQVIIPGSNVVQSLEPATGKELWRVRYDGYSVIPRPIVAGGLVMVCTGYDRPSLLAIRPDGSGDVTETHVVWQTNSNVPNTPSLNTRDGLLFMVSDKGIATCLEAATGEEMWKERIGGNFSASPLLAGDVLHLLSEEGDTTVIKADRTFEQIARNRLGERTLASMAVIDRDLLIRSASALWRIGK
jgi:outer membrane protein assembly factor BamB